jgi:hypothetical protein
VPVPAADGLEPAALPAAGEPFPLPREIRATADELRRSYGASFADAAVQLAPSSRYSAPIASSFGWHRVRLVDVAPGGRLPFEAVRRPIAFDLALQRRQDAIRRFLDTTASHYEFAVGGARLPRFAPPMRVARHETASGRTDHAPSRPRGRPRTDRRVLQTPTSRWSVFDCQRAPNANPTDCAPGGKLDVQIAERAWTSPIWYLP